MPQGTKIVFRIAFGIYLVFWWPPGPKSHTEWHQNGTRKTATSMQNNVFFEPNFGTDFEAKKGDGGGGLRSQAEPGPGGTPLDHESIILRYLEV